MKQTRSIQVIKDLDGKNIVMINDIIFKVKRHINWKDVEEYLKRYIGEFYKIAESKDIVYIGKDLPREFAHSKYNKGLARRSARNKANIVPAIPELIEIATNKEHRENIKERNFRKASNGWYKYDTRFALPVYSNDGSIDCYNVYRALLIVRCDGEKMYLYDIIQIFKI